MFCSILVLLNFSIFIYMYNWDIHSFKKYKHSLTFNLFTLLIYVALLLKIPECFYQQIGFCISICLKSFKCAISFLVVDPNCVTVVSAPLQSTTLTLCYPQPNTMMVKWCLETFEKWQNLLRLVQFPNISGIFLICAGLKHLLHLLFLFFSTLSMISSSQHYGFSCTFILLSPITSICFILNWVTSFSWKINSVSCSSF